MVGVGEASAPEPHDPIARAELRLGHADLADGAGRFDAACRSATTCAPRSIDEPTLAPTSICGEQPRLASCRLHAEEVTNGPAALGAAGKIISMVRSMEATVRILLAIDGSPSSIQARDLVASLSLPSGSSVTMLTAYDVPLGWFGDPLTSGGAGLAEAEEVVRREADATLARLAAPFSGRDWSVDRRVVRGRAPGVIVEAAAELAADLIVLGSRGHGPIASMLLGSVSAEVVERASCSVLVARGSSVSRLLVATDGSPCAELIPDLLATWGAFEGLPAVAVSVTPVNSPAFDLLVSLYTLGSLSLEPDRQEMRERHQGHAAAMAARLSENGIPAKAEVRTGDAAQEIIAAAAERQMDLIVTGSRCLHGLDRWLLGSVSRNVLLHAGVSVLIVRRSVSAAGS